MDQEDETPPNKTDRSRDGRFKKGQSGNPGGRPKIFTEVKQAAREHTEAAIETLVSVMDDENATASARVAAAVAILDRGWGKPGQMVEMNMRNKPVRELTDDELMAIAAGADEDDDQGANPEKLN
jgi:hypothetical protein